LAEVKTLAVEQWLASLPLAGKEPAPRSGDYASGLPVRSALGTHQQNPMDLVRVKGGTKRRRIPRVLQPEDFPRLLRELRQPYRTMVLIAGGLGLRRSEIVPLQWGDFDWERLTLMITRGWVQGHLGEVKTEYSHQPLPLDPDLASEILLWKEESPYPNKGQRDFVFPNLSTGKPMWPDSILKNHIKPAAERAKLGSIGWHTFRHSYRAWLKRVGRPSKFNRN
jgi:integrase